MLAAAALVVTAGGMGIATPAAASVPAGACKDQVAQPGAAIRSVPWAQKMLGFERAWPFSEGAGILVAVIDSGVDSDHPQLSAPNKVENGWDFIRLKAGARFDCISHGTAVAGIIGGSGTSGSGFHGVAPDARLVPMRVSEAEPENGGGGGNAVDPTVFATAIRYAADLGAQVVNLSVVMYADVPAVRRAVRYAQQKGSLLVAAAGNEHQRTAGDNGLPAGTDPTPYPAAYPGVLGVGAITIDGTRLDESQEGPYVDLVAPGGGVLAPTRQHGYVYWDGTSFATPFVSGAAALVRARYPQLTPAQVLARLERTADPAPGGADSAAYGHGIVDPYRAVTDGTTAGNRAVAAPQAPLTTPTPDVAAERRAAAAHRRTAHAGHLVLLAGLGAALVLGLAVVVPAGRRTGWRAARAARPPD